jgi:cysteinyl-tRNA synthetase
MMPIRIYNTITRKKETFVPIEANTVKMYVCGPTVYDACHVGHARSAVVFDVIARYMEDSGYEVTYVRNFTDVDDKIIRRAQELNTDSTTIAETYIKDFYNDMDMLHVRRANIEPKATEHIDSIIQIINRLIDKNMAYEIEGDVYFSVTSFNGYGKLSGRKLEDMEAGARVKIDDRKKSPFDFALWKTAKPGEPSWTSPWGEGRPGWHIECSAMSSQYLGQTFDIHGGGKDLIFPHHENEIAQSEAAFGVPFAKYWVHNGFVNINQEKMSKSLNNFLLIKDILKTCHPEALRLFLLSNHYRSPVDFNEKAMNEAGTALDKIYKVMNRLEDIFGQPSSSDDSSDKGDYGHRFCEAMDDDFNTAQGIGILFDAVRTINRHLDSADDQSFQNGNDFIRSAQRDINHMGRILGILNERPKAYFDAKKEDGLEQIQLDEARIEQLILDRMDARKTKDWEKADKIRDELEQMNIVLEDGPNGTLWKVASK